MAVSGKFSVGIDIGGTFTDIALIGDGGEIHTHKLLSTPQDYSIAIANGIEQLLDAQEIDASDIGLIIHATTVATNTILEFKGAKTALITTEGFRDVLEMRRLRIPVLYDLRFRKPPPLVPRRRRFELAERLDSNGQVLRAMNEEDLREIVAALKEEGVESVAICLIHAHANSDHERRIESFLAKELGDQIYLSRSSEVLPEIREYERSSTTVVNAYVGPVVASYLHSISRNLKKIGVECPLQIMHSAGGVMSVDLAVRKPSHLVESGPAAGVIAAARLAEASSRPNVISFDMGGTTAKAALVEGGKPTRTAEYEVGAGINLCSKLVKGGGYPIKLPFIDVSEIGAGGGSIVSVSEDGRISVGPESAGAEPGPVAYGRGGTEPTITDALIAMGYINPKNIVGGKFDLDREAAIAAIQEKVAARIGKGADETAHGILTLAVATMTRAIKAVSTYQGRDPRSFSLVAFGGNGPVVAAEIARSLNMAEVIIPPAAGVFSAVGLLFSDVEYELVRSVFGRDAGHDAAALSAIYHEMAQEARHALIEEGYSPQTIQIEQMADIRYAGQAYELTIAAKFDENDALDIEAMGTFFGYEHERTYGHKSDTDPFQIISLKTIARVPNLYQIRDSQLQSNHAGKSGCRSVYFGHQEQWLDTPVCARGEIPKIPRSGPLVIEEFDSTCVVPPDARVHLDDAGNVIIRFGEEE
ncbi:MAG: hydantoinase/oxoprolinase family protein [Rhizobiaceae bacterium]